jgi:glucose/arabinose dehydrogenase
LVATGLKFPRGILPLDNGNLFVVAMGGWEKSSGSVWYLTRTPSGFSPAKLIEKLDRPHGIARGPDGRIYIGVVGGLVRFSLSDPAGTLEDVVGGQSPVPALPSSGRHPLVNFVFDRAGDIYVAVGSHSDNCEAEDGAMPDATKRCEEAEGENARGSIRVYKMKWPEGSVLESHTIAHGLRNSMALAVNPVSGKVFQAENSRDAIHRHMPGLKNDEELPHDELNVIEHNKHYGWPYCHDMGLASPEYPNARCSEYQMPRLLLPAHSAPLGMAFYSGNLLASERSLVIALHGYRRHGHRVIYYSLDAQGDPIGDARDLVWGWDARAKSPKGAPTDLRVGTDGAIYLTEDRNGTVLRIGRVK